jgi:class 3 adenylate cyclase/TolB-like protein/Tfp pilus assembly protein PilF
MASERIERKLAAIVAADVAGYSRLMAADEEGTLARLKGHRKALIDPKIAEHGGRIIKTTGDGMLVEFASVVDAVRCVVEIQRGMLERNADIPPEKRIDFRVGINVGDVIVDGDDIYGDGVNVAARLEGLAEPGGILVAGVVRDQVRDKLSFSFDDLGDRNVKNIPRPVRAYRVKLNDDGPPPLAKPAARVGLGGRRIAGIVAAALLLIVVAGGGAWYVAGGAWTAAPVAEPATAPPVKPAPDLSIVVLPFANLSNDPVQDYFADGITQNLTNDLSRIDGLFIISRNTAFDYKGKAVDARQIGKELGVRYVLEGSVQRDQQRVRVTARLTDAASGGQVWGDTFEKPMSDLFNLEDEVVAQLANAVGWKLAADIAARAERNPNPDSTDLALQGLAWLNKGLTPENLAKARAFYQRALEADPNNLAALRDMAAVDTTMAGGYQGVDRAGKFASAEAALTKVLSLQPDDALAHMDLAGVELATNRGAEGIAELEHALALNPNLAAAQAGLGFAMLVNGRADETEAHVKEALRLSPHDPFAFQWVAYAAAAKLFSGADEEAVALYRRSIELYRNYPISHLYLAAALQLLGRPEQARKEAEIALQLNPKFTLRIFRAGAQTDNPVFLKQRERIIEPLRAAGIPEG